MEKKSNKGLDLSIVPAQFKKIWELADELAEKETIQAEKYPPATYVKDDEDLRGRNRVQVTWSRVVYKDSLRSSHIASMIEMLDGNRHEELKF